MNDQAQEKPWICHTECVVDGVHYEVGDKHMPLVTDPKDPRRYIDSKPNKHFSPTGLKPTTYVDASALTAADDRRSTVQLHSDCVELGIKVPKGKETNRKWLWKEWKKAAESGATAPHKIETGQSGVGDPTGAEVPNRERVMNKSFSEMTEADMEYVTLADLCAKIGQPPYNTKIVPKGRRKQDIVDMGVQLEQKADHTK